MLSYLCFCPTPLVSKNFKADSDYVLSLQMDLHTVIFGTLNFFFGVIVNVPSGRSIGKYSIPFDFSMRFCVSAYLAPASSDIPKDGLIPSSGGL